MVDQDLTKRFEGRILPIDLNVIITWGRVQGISEKNGTKLPVMDGLIAATAIACNLIVVTRNVQDIEVARRLFIILGMMFTMGVITECEIT
ncbi:type II toxin-antitoxin system VapC family toxin [Paenibacillus alginolyticus]|uniref:Type II toxin-antitoxin system VapC family toxin n=1 Tax=Paenibacillus alginolyticus TaxID=59839 RepID=A0ABT4G8J5_9BACL|nr:type II toxin-antitoxin system VapC family toxin [Paenibacillus alginolyticus]MCY9667205.1 type II toxin-antitoxin system VapC family toxin [Paenibacillus alginolyticus]MCY9692487.1 type II toxin-antitoxin system VapC family toxin [Paenibacillus alginolyticus]MEC0144280.1 type II toxin-antitoxin system VapC family toxin [Paenibacillus alginolyticus]